MRLIDADKLEQELIELGWDDDTPVVDIVREFPTVEVFEQIWNEIEELQQDILKSSETPLDSTYNISIGISMALGIIRKYIKGRY